MIITYFSYFSKYLFSVETVMFTSLAILGLSHSKLVKKSLLIYMFMFATLTTSQSAMVYSALAGKPTTQVSFFHHYISLASAEGSGGGGGGGHGNSYRALPDYSSQTLQVLQFTKTSYTL